MKEYISYTSDSENSASLAVQWPDDQKPLALDAVGDELLLRLPEQENLFGSYDLRFFVRQERIILRVTRWCYFTVKADRSEQKLLEKNQTVTCFLPERNGSPGETRNVPVQYVFFLPPRLAGCSGEEVPSESPAPQQETPETDTAEKTALAEDRDPPSQLKENAPPFLRGRKKKKRAFCVGSYDLTGDGRMDFALYYDFKELKLIPAPTRTWADIEEAARGKEIGTYLRQSLCSGLTARPDEVQKYAHLLALHSSRIDPATEKAFVEQVEKESELQSAFSYIEERFKCGKMAVFRQENDYRRPRWIMAFPNSDVTLIFHLVEEDSFLEDSLWDELETSRDEVRGSLKKNAPIYSIIIGTSEAVRPYAPYMTDDCYAAVSFQKLPRLARKIFKREKIKWAG